MESDPTIVPPAVDASTDPTVADPSVVKPAWYWVKDARGYGSVTVTMVFVSFWVTTMAYSLSIVDHIGKVAVRPFDVGACSAYFIPILTLYFGRKFTDAKFNAKG